MREAAFVLVTTFASVGVTTFAVGVTTVAAVGATPYAALAQVSDTAATSRASDTAGAVQSSARRISVSWTEAPIRDVLRAFAVFSGTSIVAGQGVEGTVTADINDRPWDVALRTVLEARGLVAVENEYGIIRVDDVRTLHDREAVEPLLTRSYRLSFVEAAEMLTVIQPLLSERGRVSMSPSTNTVVVTDIERVHRAIGGLIR